MLRLLFWGVGEIERESFTSKERRVIYVHEPDGPSVLANITPGWLVATMLCLFALASRSLIHLQIFARTHLHAFACTHLLALGVFATFYRWPSPNMFR